MNEQNGPYRNYCITWNFPDDTEIISELVEKRKQALLDLPTKYIVCQLERGNENHRLHYQGLLILNNSQRHSYLRKRLPGAHIERCHDIQKSIEYCTKSDTRVEDATPIIRGEPPAGRGHRSDISRINDLIKEGATISQIWESVPNSTLLHIRAIIEIRKFLHPNLPGRRKKVWILWGPTGTGKTRLVRDYFKEEELYILPPNSGTNNVFFDFYDPRQHRAVLIDDFYGYWKWSAMLQICDRYPMQVQTRNSSPTYFFPEHLIFTSNRSPESWYPNMNYKTLKRRIHEVHHFPEWKWGAYRHTVYFDGQLGARRQSTESESMDKQSSTSSISSRTSRIRHRDASGTSVSTSDEEVPYLQRSQKNRKRTHITVSDEDLSSNTSTVVYSDEEVQILQTAVSKAIPKTRLQEAIYQREKAIMEQNPTKTMGKKKIQLLQEKEKKI